MILPAIRSTAAKASLAPSVYTTSTTYSASIFHNCITSGLVAEVEKTQRRDPHGQTAEFRAQASFNHCKEKKTANRFKQYS